MYIIKFLTQGLNVFFILSVVTSQTQIPLDSSREHYPAHLLHSKAPAKAYLTPLSLASRLYKPYKSSEQSLRNTIFSQFLIEICRS